MSFGKGRWGIIGSPGQYKGTRPLQKIQVSLTQVEFSIRGYGIIILPKLALKPCVARPAVQLAESAGAYKEKAAICGSRAAPRESRNIPNVMKTTAKRPFPRISFKGSGDSHQGSALEDVYGTVEGQGK